MTIFYLFALCLCVKVKLQDKQHKDTEASHKINLALLLALCILEMFSVSSYSDILRLYGITATLPTNSLRAMPEGDVLCI